jgi:cobalamin biosynthesis protein CobD/CbiB
MSAILQRALAWIRARLVIIIFAAILIFQYLNWQAIREVAASLPRDPPPCSSYKPCIVELTPYTLKQLKP